MSKTNSSEVDSSQGGEQATRSIDNLAGKLAHAIWTNWKPDESAIRELLVQFADEIKREAIEP
jgi:hypothetical protein